MRSIGLANYSEDVVDISDQFLVNGGTMLTSEFDASDLQYILETCSGAADEVDWKAANTLELTFSEIGYDSIALLEIVARIQRDYGIRIPDDAIPELRTPRLVIRYVNELLAEI